MIGADSVEGAELVTGPLVVTLERPGVGTIVVTTRRLTTWRTTTGRDSVDWLALSWWVRRASMTAKSAIDPQITSAGPGFLRGGRSVTVIASVPLAVIAAGDGAAGAAGVSHHRGGGAASG